MTVKKIIGTLHLWLGLGSGLVVLIISLTGCLYAFQAEISEATQPYRYVKAEQRAFLPPSRLKAIAQTKLPDKKTHSVQYQGRQQAAIVSFYDFDPEYYYLVYLNPYSGEVLQTKNMDRDFFRIVLQGHYYLWLPPAIGQPLVASSTLVFLVMLITGLVLWWPKNKGAAKQRFTIKWSARWRRKNYDLHNVLGIYATWVLIILVVTGLVWGFQWFAKATYWTISGGEKLQQYQEPLSDTTHLTASVETPAVDKIWLKMKAEYPTADIIEVHIPEHASAPIAASINPDAKTYWQTDYRYFDQYTLKELSVNHPWGRYRSATTADKITRMNYDIHVGAIWGLPGKMLAFFASLIAASLPVTGFYIWWGRRNKNTTPRSSSPSGKKATVQQKSVRKPQTTHI